MEPTIGQSVARGFAVARQGWQGIAVYAVGSLLIGLVVIGLIMTTRIPQSLMQGPQAGPAATSAPDALRAIKDTAAQAGVSAVVTEGAADATEEAMDAAGDAADTVSAPLEDAGNDFFGDETESPLADLGLSGDQAAEWEQAATDWLRRAWPVLVLCFLFSMAAGLWLNGGQIGYAGQLDAAGSANLSVYWASAKKSFVSLLGAWGISIAGVLVIALAIGLLGLILGLMTALPVALVVILGVLLGGAMVAGMVWLSIRLVFWFPAIVLDGTGPIAGLKQSFAVTRGRWWKVFLLGLVVALISLGVGIVFQLLGAAAGAAGGAAGVFTVIVAIAGLVANLYIGFVLLTVYVNFYRALKTAPAAGGAKRA